MLDCSHDDFVNTLLRGETPAVPQEASLDDSGLMSTTVRRLIGIAISLCASLFYAVGLNLIRKDSIRNEQLPKKQRRPDYRRPMWLLGMVLFLGSQVCGQTFVIGFLDPLWIGPLGAVTLIFNCILAHFFVKSVVTRTDIIGTTIVVLSVVWIVLWGNQKSAEAPASTSLCYFTYLYTRTPFIIYFLVIDGMTLLFFAIAMQSKFILRNERRHKRSKIWKNVSKRHMQKAIGVCFATVGGLLASQTVLLGNSGIAILQKSIQGDNQFNQGTALPAVIVSGLAITAILQVLCLNSALTLLDSKIVVPIFYAFYTAVGLFNTMVYFSQFKYYTWFALLFIFVGMLVLVYGVRLLSIQAPAPGENSGYSTCSESINVAGAETFHGFAGQNDDDPDAVIVVTAERKSSQSEIRADPSISATTGEKKEKSSGSRGPVIKKLVDVRQQTGDSPRLGVVIRGGGGCGIAYGRRKKSSDHGNVATKLCVERKKSK